MEFIFSTGDIWWLHWIMLGPIALRKSALVTPGLPRDFSLAQLAKELDLCLFL